MKFQVNDKHQNEEKSCDFCWCQMGWFEYFRNGWFFDHFTHMTLKGIEQKQQQKKTSYVWWMKHVDKIDQMRITSLIMHKYMS